MLDPTRPTSPTNMPHPAARKNFRIVYRNDTGTHVIFNNDVSAAAAREWFRANSPSSTVVDVAKRHGYVNPGGVKLGKDFKYRQYATCFAHGPFVLPLGELLDCPRCLRMRQGQPCGQSWVAEIELCPRCGLDAAAHVGM